MTEDNKLEAKVDDLIEIVSEGERLIARVTWEKFSFECALPKGFETWDREEMRAHFTRFVAPELKTKMENARAIKSSGTITEYDMARLAKAEAKRERKLKLCK